MKFRVLVWVGCDGTLYLCSKHGGALFPSLSDGKGIPHETYLFGPEEDIGINPHHLTGDTSNWFVQEVEV